MAPLDTGHVMNLRLVDPLEQRAGPSPADFEQIGAYLRAVRQHRGMTLDALAEKTRISKSYLRAIEEADLSVLPSRPFAIGYVRSYAAMLGVDGDAAAARFKTETPDYAEPLRNPVGVKHETRRRNPLIMGGVAVVVVAVIAWNVTQHSAAGDNRKPPEVSLAVEAPPQPKALQGPITLGAATPPPADQTTPAAYVTPGMSATTDQTTAGASKTATKAPLAPPAPTGYAEQTTFTPKGAVYGAAAGTPGVILQAKKPTSLIMRGAGGAVYFARQLAPGEAYRAPLGAGLMADIADPSALDLYADGKLQAAPLVGLTAVYKLVTKPAS